MLAKPFSLLVEAYLSYAIQRTLKPKKRIMETTSIGGRKIEMLKERERVIKKDWILYEVSSNCEYFRNFKCNCSLNEIGWTPHWIQFQSICLRYVVETGWNGRNIMVKNRVCFCWRMHSLQNHWKTHVSTWHEEFEEKNTFIGLLCGSMYGMFHGILSLDLLQTPIHKKLPYKIRTNIIRTRSQYVSIALVLESCQLYNTECFEVSMEIFCVLEWYDSPSITMFFEILFQKFAVTTSYATSSCI